MLKPLLPKLRSDLSVRLSDIAKKQVPAKLKPLHPIILQWSEPFETEWSLTLPKQTKPNMSEIETTQSPAIYASHERDLTRPALSPGQLSAQRAVLEVRRLRSRHGKAVEAFVEEAVVRRELADNFCFHQPHYDSVRGAYGWAAETLKLHRSVQVRRPGQVSSGQTGGQISNERGQVGSG